MAKHKLLRATHSRFENGELRVYRVGDVIDLTPGEAKSAGDRVAYYPDQTKSPKAAPTTSTATDTGDAETGEAADGEFDFVSTETVASLVDIIDGMDSVESLNKMRVVEAANKSRIGVINAIDQRVKDLTGG